MADTTTTTTEGPPALALKSNNPFRFSLQSDDLNQPHLLYNPPLQPPADSPRHEYTRRLTEPTIPELDEDGSYPQHHPLTPSSLSSPMSTSTPPPLPAVPMPSALPTGGLKKALSNDHIIITIQPTSTTSLTEATPTTPAQRFSVECCQADQGKWPARRMQQKSRMKSKRTRIIIKVVCAIVIIVGASAIGLGISKAVRDARKPK